MSRRPALLLAASSLLSRLLGVVRDHIYAVKFGASAGAGHFSLDAYYAAFRLPDLLYQLIIAGTVSAALIPIFLEHLHAKNPEAKKEAWRFASALLNLFGIFLILAGMIIFLGAPWLVPWLTPGFSGEKLEATILLTRLMLLAPIFFGLSSVISALANAFKIFSYFALAPVVYNLSLIAAAYLGAEKFGVNALGLGVVVGALVHFAVQIPALWQIHFQWSPLLGLRRADIKKAFTLLIPRIAATALLQINLVVDTVIASTLGAGALAILNLAYNIHSLPVGVVGVSVALVAFATLAEYFVRGEEENFLQALRKNLATILRWVVPASVGMYLLAAPLVHLILRGGKFTDNDTVLTVNFLQWLLIGLFAYALTPTLARAFFARQNTRLPLLSSAIALGVNIIGSILFSKIFQLKGLALANTLAGILNFILLLYWLKKTLQTDWQKIFPWSATLRILVLSAIMGLAVALFLTYTQTFFPLENFFSATAQTLGAATLGSAIYFGGEKIWQKVKLGWRKNL